MMVIRQALGARPSWFVLVIEFYGVTVQLCAYECR